MSDSFPAFLLASFILAITPGPGVLYLVARTVSHGRRAGFLSVLGVAMGNLCNALAAGLGVALLFGAVPAAYHAVRYAGAAYLCFLGILAFRRAHNIGVESPAPPPASIHFVRDGFLASALNPKVTLFFAAYVPQFIDATAHPLSASVLFSAGFVLLAAFTDSLYVLASSSAQTFFAAPARRNAVASVEGLILIGLAAYSVAAPQALTPAR